MYAPAQSADADRRIPVTLLTGFLGAGKTTLLNRWLAEAHCRRLAVLVNDFGAINVDAALIASSAGDAIALSNGCVCVLGNRELMNSVEAAAGKEAVVTLPGKWMDVLAQGGVRDASAGLAMNGMFQRMMNRAATVGLLGRVSTLLVQSTQLAAASVQMPVSTYLRRFQKLFGGQLDWEGAIQSAFIQRRIKTAPPIVRQAFENLANTKSPNEIKRATYNLGKLLSGTDGLFTGGTYAILLDYHRETGSKLGLTGADLEEHAHREAERATEQVAQPNAGSPG